MIRWAFVLHWFMRSKFLKYKIQTTHASYIQRSNLAKSTLKSGLKPLRNITLCHFHFITTDLRPNICTHFDSLASEPQLHQSQHDKLEILWNDIQKSIQRVSRQSVKNHGRSKLTWDWCAGKQYDSWHDYCRNRRHVESQISSVLLGGIFHTVCIRALCTLFYCVWPMEGTPNMHEQCWDGNASLDQVRECIRNEHAVMLLIRGVPGSGKTHLARLVRLWLHKHRFIFCMIAIVLRTQRLVQYRGTTTSLLIHIQKIQSPIFLESFLLLGLIEYWHVNFTRPRLI